MSPLIKIARTNRKENGATKEEREDGVVSYRCILSSPGESDPPPFLVKRYSGPAGLYLARSATCARKGVHFLCFQGRICTVTLIGNNKSTSLLGYHRLRNDSAT